MAGAWYFKGPAGSAAGPVGPQTGAVFRAGVPRGSLPGYTNAREAERARRQVAGYIPDTPQVPEEMRCFADYLVQQMCNCLIGGLLNIQTTSRLPSHRDVPYSGECFQRHRGTGADPGGIGGHPDLPVTLPPVAPGGPFTTLIDYTVDQGQNGVVVAIGLDTFPDTPATRGAVELRGRIIGSGQVAAPPFDQAHGSVAPNAEATWFGFAGTVADPNTRVCIKLKPNQTFILEARNTFGGGPIDVAAIVDGWHYTPTVQSDDPIRGTLTDQR